MVEIQKKQAINDSETISVVQPSFATLGPCIGNLVDSLFSSLDTFVGKAPLLGSPGIPTCADTGIDGITLHVLKIAASGDGGASTRDRDVVYTARDAELIKL